MSKLEKYLDELLIFMADEIEKNAKKAKKQKQAKINKTKREKGKTLKLFFMFLFNILYVALCCVIFFS